MNRFPLKKMRFQKKLLFANTSGHSYTISSLVQCSLKPAIFSSKEYKSRPIRCPFCSGQHAGKQYWIRKVKNVKKSSKVELHSKQVSNCTCDLKLIRRHCIFLNIFSNLALLIHLLVTVMIFVDVSFQKLPSNSKKPFFTYKLVSILFLLAP